MSIQRFHLSRENEPRHPPGTMKFPPAFVLQSFMFELVLYRLLASECLHILRRTWEPLVRILEVTSNEGADFLLLAGEPLNEPVAAQGSMVMNSPEEINLAYRDYQSGRMGAPWSETLTDEEWMQHVAKFPSAYKADESSME